MPKVISRSWFNYVAGPAKCVVCQRQTRQHHTPTCCFVGSVGMSEFAKLRPLVSNTTGGPMYEVQP